MKITGKSIGFAVLLLAATTAGACDQQAPTARDDGGMTRFRTQAMMKIHAENRVALGESLKRQQSALLELTRDRYLAAVPGPGHATQGAKAAP